MHGSLQFEKRLKNTCVVSDLPMTGLLEGVRCFIYHALNIYFTIDFGEHFPYFTH